MEFEKRATCMTTFASNYLWRISPVSNEITVIPVLEEATMRSSSQQHVTLPISCPASGTVSNNEPSLMSQTLTTPSCDPVTKQNATINNWQQQNWLEIRDSRGAEHGSTDFRRTTSSVHFFFAGGGQISDVSPGDEELSARGTSYVRLLRQTECNIAVLQVERHTAKCSCGHKNRNTCNNAFSVTCSSESIHRASRVAH